MVGVKWTCSIYTSPARQDSISSIISLMSSAEPLSSPRTTALLQPVETSCSRSQQQYSYGSGDVLISDQHSVWKLRQRGAVHTAPSADIRAACPHERHVNFANLAVPAIITWSNWQTASDSMKWPTKRQPSAAAANAEKVLQYHQRPLGSGSGRWQTFKFITGAAAEAAMWSVGGSSVLH